MPHHPPHIRIGTCTSESSTKKTTHNLCVGPTHGICSPYLNWAIICVKVRGCYLVRIHVLRLLPIRFIQQGSCRISKSTNETYAETGLKFKPPLVYLWLSEVYICRFLNWIHMFPQHCSLYEQYNKSWAIDVCSTYIAIPPSLCKIVDSIRKPIRVPNKILCTW